MNKTQRNVLEFISRYWALYHCSPKLLDVKKGVGLSQTPVYQAIQQLKDEGYLFIGINRRPIPIWVINAIDSSTKDAYERSLLTEYKDREKDNKKISGYVYVVCDAIQHLYKIGRTNNFDKRLVSIKKEYGDSIAVICLFETNDMIELERKLHDRFCDFWQHGEWFDLTQKHIAYIEWLHNKNSGVIIL